MRVSTIRSGSAAIAVAIALAACGGHGTVPSQSVLPGTANNLASDAFDSGLSPDGKTPRCEVTGLYYFHGSCVGFNMNMNSTTVVQLGKFGAYHGIKITTGLSKFVNPPKVNTVPAIMGDAIGKGDITGKVKGKAFPLYATGNNCVAGNGKPEKCPGKVFVYAELINSSQYKLKPASTPAFSITSENGYPGKTLCFPAILTAKGWAPNETIGGKPNGKTLRIPAAPNPGQLVFLPHAQFIVAGVCV
jgi:hypothetical protein